jgi:hypothetical protein
MSEWPAPTRRDHQRFCEIEGWELKPGDHEFYYLALHDGSVLYTKISRPVGRQGYGHDIWHRQILGQQLQVSESEFWACVQEGVLPDRGAPATPVEALPVDLVWQLRSKVGLSDAEIFALTRAEAIERMRQHWMRG